MSTAEIVLSVGRYAFLGLLYLFVLLVLRALLAEMRAEVQPAVLPMHRGGPRPAVAVPGAPVAPAEERPEPRIPAQPLPPRLIVVESADPGQLPVGMAFTVTAVTTIGRGPHNSLALPTDKHVSNNHALLFVRDGTIRLRDRGSTNGTYVNGERIEDEAPLNDGDRITVGTTVLRFSAQQISVSLSVEDGDAD